MFYSIDLSLQCVALYSRSISLEDYDESPPSRQVWPFMFLTFESTTRNCHLVVTRMLESFAKRNTDVLAKHLLLPPTEPVRYSLLVLIFRCSSLVFYQFTGYNLMMPLLLRTACLILYVLDVREPNVELSSRCREDV